MTPFHLTINESNFHWPGKVQSFVYRMIELRKIRNGFPADIDNARFKSMTTEWADRLFGNESSIRHYQINFGHEVDISSIGFSGRGFNQLNVKILIETNLREFYQIQVDLERSMDECCSVFHEPSDGTHPWAYNNVNIFDLKYVDTVRIYSKDGTMTETKNYAQTGLGTFSFMENMPRSYSAPDFIAAPPTPNAYVSLSNDEVNHFLSNEQPPESKESREFRELKDKISGMADVIRKTDS